MLNKILKIVMIAPILVMGVSFSDARAEEKQVKPNIHQLTTDKAAEKISKSTEYEEPRIPGEIHKSSIGIGIGQTFLRGDLGDNGNDKITPDLYYNYSASYSFDLMANAHWSTHEYLNRTSTIRGLDFAIKGKGFQYDAFSPFAFGGFGFYLPGATRLIGNNQLVETRNQLVFGINFGAGAELRLNDKVTVGVIAHYHDPFDVRQDIGPALGGSYMKLLIMAMYTLN